MRMKLTDFDGQYRIFSLALDETTHLDLLAEDVDHLFLHDCSLEICPDGLIADVDASTLDELRCCNNYDAFEVFPDGRVNKCYDDRADDNLFYVTGKCNSNCIMCPMPEITRRRSDDASVSHLIELASHVSVSTPHITITGGEPFLAGKEIFRLLEFCRSKFTQTEFLILTNGRAFAIMEYCDLLAETLPQNSILGIPLHGSCPVIHDSLSRTPGSYIQTLTGLHRLHKLGLRLEIRIVVCRGNLDDLPSIAGLIVSDLPHAERVCIMAMEMTGAAFHNRDDIWVPYRASAHAAQKAIDILVNAGIDVRLYNFPLCTVDARYWTVCYKSITDYKIRYADACESCSVKDACGGVFAGTFALVKDELMPV